MVPPFHRSQAGSQATERKGLGKMSRRTPASARLSAMDADWWAENQLWGSASPTQATAPAALHTRSTTTNTAGGPGSDRPQRQSASEAARKASPADAAAFRASRLRSRPASSPSS